MATLLNLRYKSANIDIMLEELQKEYELICILPPQLEGADLENVKKEIEQITTGLGGTINFKETKKHELAYPINKQGQGIYLISQASISPEKVANLSNELKLNKQVLRHLITQLPSYAKATAGKPAKKRKVEPSEIKRKKAKSAEAPTRRSEGGVKLEEIDKKLDEIIEEI